MDISELYNYSHIDLNTFRFPNSTNVLDTLDSSQRPTTNIPQISTSLKSATSSDVDSENKVMCRMCGRLLTDSTSRMLGMGPSCYKQFRAEHSKQINLFHYKPLSRG